MNRPGTKGLSGAQPESGNAASPSEDDRRLPRTFGGDAKDRRIAPRGIAASGRIVCWLAWTPSGPGSRTPDGCNGLERRSTCRFRRSSERAADRRNKHQRLLKAQDNASTPRVEPRRSDRDDGRTQAAPHPGGDRRIHSGMPGDRGGKFVYGSGRHHGAAVPLRCPWCTGTSAER